MWLVSAGVAEAAECDASAIAKGKAALGQVGREQVPTVAAAALREGCTWAPAVGEGLERLWTAGPEHATLVDLQLATSDPVALGAACHGKFGELAKLGGLAPAERRRFVWTTCGVPFATEAEWTAASGLLLTPLLMHAALPGKGVDADTTRAFARALAGI